MQVFDLWNELYIFLYKPHIIQTNSLNGGGCVKIEISYQCVILSIAKDLITSALCKQILHFVPLECRKTG